MIDRWERSLIIIEDVVSGKQKRVFYFPNPQRRRATLGLGILFIGVHYVSMSSVYKPLFEEKC